MAFKAARHPEAGLNLGALLEAAVDKASDGILLLDSRDDEFRVVYANPAVLESSGYEMAALHGMLFESLFRTPRPPLRTRLKKRHPVRFQTKLRKASGKLLSAELSLRPIPSPADEAAYWIAVFASASDPAASRLSNAESRYQLLFEHQSRPTWLYDDETFRFLEVNQAAIRTYGYSREEFLKMTILDLRPTEDRESVREYIAQRKSKGVSIPEIWRHRRKDGSIFLVEVQSSEIRIGGRRVRLVETNDVSAKRALEEQLRQAQKMEAVGLLAGGISHDFNNLLTVINGYSSMLAQRLEPEHPMREEIEAIQRSGERAAALTRQLLAFSRKQVLLPRLIDLNQLIVEMRSMLERVIREDIELITDLGPGPCATFADPTQIEQVVMNLVINARDAIHGHGVITIETRSVEPQPQQPDPYIALSVRDTGSGIEPEVLGHLFEPFYTTKEKGRGTGLGLSTVYGIVQQSGGRISVDSAMGRGTCFTIFLKAAQPAGIGETASSEPVQEKHAAGTVLLVEDDEEVRQFISRALKDFGHRVLTARDGAEAVHVATVYPDKIDLLISDVIMPKMNGYDLARHLGEHRPGLKILFLSGYAEDSYGIQSLGRDAELLPKPFTPAQLGTKIREMLER